MLVDLSSFILQQDSLLNSEIFWVAMGSIAAAIGVAYSSFSQWDSNRKEREQRAEQDRKEREQRTQELYERYTRQISELLKEERGLKTKADCEWYAVAYLDLIDSIARLYNLKIVGEDVVNYFQYYFKYGKRILEWIPKNDDGWFAFAKEPAKVWFDLVKLCDERDYEPVEDLPRKMKNFKSLRDE